MNIAQTPALNIDFASQRDYIFGVLATVRQSWSQNMDCHDALKAA